VKFLLRLTAVAVAVAGVAAACSDDDGAGVRASASASASASGSGPASGPTDKARCEPVGDRTKADTTVSVTLSEFAITLSRRTVPAGTVAFVARNAGAEPHEFVIVRAASAAALPTDDDGAVVEDRLAAGAEIGEVEAFPSDSSCHGTFDLTPGRYVMFCNLVDEHGHGGSGSHFAQGMHTTFEVT
jgi:hypothetical protein